MWNPFKIPNIPSYLTLNGWDNYWNQIKKEFPVRYFINRFMPRFLNSWYTKLWKDPIYWIKCRFWHKYHLIDVRNKRNGYGWGWLEVDHALMFASFKIFADFMEEQYPGYVDWDDDWQANEYKDDPKTMELVKERRQIRQDIKDLYQWWTVDYKNEEDMLNELLMGAYDNLDILGDFQEVPEDQILVGDIYRIYKTVLEEKEQQMLHKLIDIRHYLWT